MSQTRDEVVREFKKESKEKSEAFREKSGMSDRDMKVVDAMACVVTIIARFQHIWPMLPNQTRKDFAQTLWKVKENFDQSFPSVTNDGTRIEDYCIMCDILQTEGDKEPCTHADSMRIAMVTMAVMKVRPDYDMDESDDEIPDANEGMIPTDVG